MGFSHPSAAAIFIASSNFLCTLVALKLVDRLGRRPLLLRSLAGMAAGLFLIGFAFLFIRRPKEGEEVVARAGAAAYLNVLCMVVFSCSYALGLGNVVRLLLVLSSSKVPLTARSSRGFCSPRSSPTRYGRSATV